MGDRDIPIHEALPQPRDGESSFEYAQRIQDALIKWQKKRKMGAEPDPTFKRTIRYFSQIYAYKVDNENHVVTEEELEWGIEMGLAQDQDLTKHKLDTFPSRIGDWFRRVGWRPVKEFIPPDSDLFEAERIHVSNQIPTTGEVKEEIEADKVISTLEIESALREIAPFAEREDGEDKQLTASTAFIESSLKEQRWLQAQGVEEPVRIWANPDALFNSLNSTVEERSTISLNELNESVISFIEENDTTLPPNLQIQVGNILSEFEVRLREQNWAPVQFDEGKKWYSNIEDHTEALQEELKKHEDILDDPLHHDSEEIKPVHGFLRSNDTQLVRRDLWDHNILQNKIRRLELHAEADEWWDLNEEAERPYDTATLNEQDADEESSEGQTVEEGADGNT